MFKEHQPRIGAWARENPDNFGRLLQFVILTIRMPLHRVSADMEIVDRGDKDAASVLFGFKARAWAEAWETREATLAFLEHVWQGPDDSRDKELAMLEHVAGLYGFGPVKAGFVLQLAYGISGRIDTHNLSRFGYKPTAFKNFSELKTPKARRAFLERYTSAVYRAGGTEALWDGWCAYVARQTPGPYQGSAYEVSRAHCVALGLERGRYETE
jgi:hypothetical protein